jgi:hypothetical protein
LLAATPIFSSCRFLLIGPLQSSADALTDLGAARVPNLTVAPSCRRKARKHSSHTATAYAGY